MKYHVVKRSNPLNKTEIKYYAAPQYGEELTLMDLAMEISDASTLNVIDVEAVLIALLRKLPIHLKNGLRVQLGSFGRVKLSFSSKGCDKEEDVDASSITNIRILFTPNSALKRDVEQVSFSKA